MCGDISESPVVNVASAYKNHASFSTNPLFRAGIKWQLQVKNSFFATIKYIFP